ncbi:hypothetical protein MPH_11142 [Macrophomina phaseolina MS6]|uniref:Secreted protein n=1 Tax=Macrophomina phaseolina (strain MS6) TaxID=1126212 RepID=K2RN82_MACPH|nr:hypothetical protein MPH_11142 [Macrophomina phaseolina MS6]
MRLLLVMEATMRTHSSKGSGGQLLLLLLLLEGWGDSASGVMACEVAMVLKGGEWELRVAWEMLEGRGEDLVMMGRGRARKLRRVKERYKGGRRRRGWQGREKLRSASRRPDTERGEGERGSSVTSVCAIGDPRSQIAVSRLGEWLLLLATERRGARKAWASGSKCRVQKARDKNVSHPTSSRLRGYLRSNHNNFGRSIGKHASFQRHEFSPLVFCM